MRQVIATGLGLLFGVTAAFAGPADAVKDGAQATGDVTKKAVGTTAGVAKKTVKTTHKATKKSIRAGQVLESKAASGSAKALDTTGKAMKKALK